MESAELPERDSGDALIDLGRRLQETRGRRPDQDLSEIIRRMGSSERRELQRLAAALARAVPTSEHRRAIDPLAFGGGRFKILETLGEGGQGRVYLAEDSRLGRRVALKVLMHYGQRSATARERFRREAHAASRLDHPGICTLYDSGEDQGVPYLVMRYLEGELLSSRISKARHSTGSPTTSRRTGTFDPMVGPTAGPATGSAAPERPTPDLPKTRDAIDGLLRLFEKVARALAAAHAMGVVHRDVKPGNIMITEGEEPVILDFGLAHVDDEENGALTETGDSFGTPAYMSPEQIDRRLGRPDHRTDVYSLGITLFEALALARPFDEPTRHLQCAAVLEKSPPRLRTLNPQVSRDLEVVVATAIEKDRERRYASTEEFADDLARLQRGEAVKARPIGAITRFHRWVVREPMLAGALFAAVLILVAGVTTTALKAHELSVERDRYRDKSIEFERLADERRLDELVLEAESRFAHVGPDRIEALRDWIARAESLTANRDRHAGDLERLRRSALPLTAADGALQEEEGRRLDLEAERCAKRLETSTMVLRASRIQMAEEPERREMIVPWLEARCRLIEAELAALRTQREERGIWRFASPEDGWRHDHLRDLVRDIDAFLVDDPRRVTLPAMRRKLDAASQLEETTVLKPSAAWEAAIAAIRESPHYGGLEIGPQLGLVPLGMNPEGYAEFVHAETGQAPRRGADGRLELEDDSGIILVLLPGGKFRMGSPAAEPGSYQDETQQELHLDPFFVSACEVTQAQWLRITHEVPSSYRPGPDHAGRPFGESITWMHPVETVSWFDCERFCRAVDLELPSEAQWEYACRAGTSTAFSLGDDPALLEGRVNVADRSLEKMGSVVAAIRTMSWDDGWTTHAPADFGFCNGFGLKGMHGNVGEWCLDRYREDAVERLGPTGEDRGATSEERSIRDGNWLVNADIARSSRRHHMRPDLKAETFGLRPVRSLRP